ncbi:hypothetical protein Bca52824_045144 [Brassica carinata]|uniref:HMA domain-containing protein n=2 Tax=Brassica TaxID=3705 RepID=A0A8X7UMP4_BRACI|nr:hypothetical protein Bca52824_045144 [Brassica carinata]
MDDIEAMITSIFTASRPRGTEIKEPAMQAMRLRTLMLCEELSLPSFQVIVVNADVGCDHCQDRVSKIVSKMNGIEEYVVDVKNKQVMARGDFKPRLVSHQQVKNVASQTLSQNAKRFFRPLNLFLRSIFSICLCPNTL